MRFSDKLTLDSTEPRMTRDGYLVASAKVAKTGIQTYMPDEMGVEGSQPIRVYRPETEVFGDALASFANRPMTNNHPDEPVTADNWKALAVGYSGEAVARDGDFVRVPLIMTDAASIGDFQEGKRELSMGYDADIDWTPGVTPDGQHYDAIQRNIRNNHIALVDQARAGHEARIGDKGGQKTDPESRKGGQQMADTVKAMVDGLEIETTKQGAQVIGRLTKQVEDAEAKATEAGKTHQKALDAKDTELAAKDAEIDKLKGQVMTADELDAAIKKRADLIDTARKVADIDYTGLSEDGVRQAAVDAVHGEGYHKDKSPAYVMARFDMMVEGADAEDMIKGHLNRSETKPTTNDNGQAAYEKRMSDAWKGA